jgi:serine/threonine protein kinase
MTGITHDIRSITSTTYSNREKSSRMMASPTFASLAGQHALESVAFDESQSKLESRIVRKLQWSDVKVDLTIGTGTYCSVQRVRLDSSLGLLEDAYALKSLRPKTKESEQSFRIGASDLALEGSILARLNHENIVQLHGVLGYGCISDTAEEYFLILDLLLADTLKDRMLQWRRDNNSSKASLLLLPRRSQHLKSSAVLGRLERVAVGLVNGMKYLHDNNVVLRDLKPDNVGFDENGKVKLFDFGFAREVHACDPNEIAGSLRYMSPENMHGNPAGLAGDVYSFGVLLWELCTLEKPYEKFELQKDLFQKVAVEQWRPSLRSIKSKPLRDLIKWCWDAIPENRPTFTEIQKDLEAILISESSSSEDDIKSSSSHHKKSGAGTLIRSNSMRNIIRSLTNSIHRNSSSTKLKIDNRLEDKDRRRPPFAITESMSESSSSAEDSSTKSFASR